MANEVTPLVNRFIADIHSDLLSFPIVRASDRMFWNGHLPIVPWLIRSITPRVFVELGTETGVSYCGFCNAVRELGAPTRCWAVDTWEGDLHVGEYGEDVGQSLREFHDRHFSPFSQLIKSTFEEALPRFSDSEIDLLHIDGCHTYEAVRNDFYSWLPKLSSRGVVLLHDTNVRIGSFGVWKFLEEIRQIYPVFEFIHSNGLAIVAVGKDVAPEIRWLTETVSRDSESVTVIRAAAARLGEVAVERSIVKRLKERWNCDTLTCNQKLSTVPAPYEVAAALKRTQFLERRVHRLQAELTDKRHQNSSLLRRLENATRESEQTTRDLASKRGEIVPAIAHWSKSLREENLRKLSFKVAAFLERIVTSSLGGRALSLALLPLATVSQRATRVREKLLRFQRNESGGYRIERLVHESGLFDYTFYLEHNSDVLNSGMDPLTHFLKHGGVEGRSPSLLFDSRFYLSRYPDVEKQGINPLVHYIMYGAREGRDPHPYFDTSFYVNTYPDVATANINPLRHYIEHGSREQRQPHPLFTARSFFESSSIASSR